MTFTISADLFRIAYKCVSTEETRYYLNGVYVQRAIDGAGALLVSTDGHRLLCVRDESATGDIPEGGVIVSAVPAQVRSFKTSKQGRVDMTPLTLTLSDSKHAPAMDCELSEGDRPLGSIYLHKIDGTFPDWRRVVPVINDEPQQTGNFNAAYVSDFADVGVELSKCIGGGRVTSMTMLCQRADAPALVRWDAAPAFGVLMPLRVNADEIAMPAWMSAKKQKKAKEPT